MIVDPPSPFAHIEEWRTFLEQLKMFPPSKEVNEQIRLAEETIAEKEKTGI